MSRTRLSAALSIAVLAALPLAPHAHGNTLTVRIAETELPAGQVLSIVVDNDGDSPATVSVALTRGHALLTIGATIDVGPANGPSIFKGEIVGVEPALDRSGHPIVNIRGFSRLHRLTRGRRSRVFTGRSEGEIVHELAQEAGLTAETAGPEANIRHDHVSQHNQTDLEFLQERAARIGYQLYADGTTIHFEKRRDSPPATVGCDPAAALLRAFLARLSSTRSVKEVTVRGWDPVKQEEIIGRARQSVIGLSPLASRIDPPPATLDLGTIEALQSGEASHAVASGALMAMTKRDVSAEIDAEGTPAIRPGASVVLNGMGAAFDGTYLVTQTSHRFDQRARDGWHTFVRLARADRALYLLPEVGDEVLVAFEHGDPAQPVIVGSLWSAPDPPPDSSPCRRD